MINIKKCKPRCDMKAFDSNILLGSIENAFIHDVSDIEVSYNEPATFKLTLASVSDDLNDDMLTYQVSITQQPNDYNNIFDIHSILLNKKGDVNFTVDCDIDVGFNVKSLIINELNKQSNTNHLITLSGLPSNALMHWTF